MTRNLTASNLPRAAFLRSLPLTAAALGDKLGVEVHVGGSDCFTNGYAIFLPAVVQGVTEDEMLGYVVHESAHIRYTTFGTFFDTPFEKELLNALEDVRIEHEISALYPGVRMLLDACHEKHVEELTENPERVTAHAGRLLAFYALCRAHALWTKLDYIKPLFTILSRAVEDRFGEPVKTGIDREIDSLPNAAGTEAVAEIVRRITEILKNAGQNVPQPEPSPQSSRSGQSPQKGGSSGTPSEDGNGRDGTNAEPGDGSDSDSSGKASGSRSSRKGSGKKGKASGQKSGAGSGASDEPQKDGNEPGNRSGSSGNGPDEACREAIDSTADDFGETPDVSRRYRTRIKEAAKDNPLVREMPYVDLGAIAASLNWEGDLSYPGRKAGKESTYAEETGRIRIERAVNRSSEARRALLGLVRARTRANRWVSNSGRRISTTSAARLATWDTRVFEKKSEVTAVDTAFHVLLDVSGSMHNELEEAITASLSLMAALSGIPHVNPALSAFNGTSPFQSVVPHGAKCLSRYAGRIGRLKARDDTPLAEALLAVSIALSKTREAKKTVLVITDGEPNHAGGAEMVAKRMREAGIRVYALGINNYRPGGFYDAETSIGAVGSLEAALLKIGKEIAMEGLS